MEERLMNVTELALTLNVAVNTIGYWYRFKKSNPTHPLCEFLPEPERVGTNQQRFWKTADVPLLLQFKASVPKGRNGILAEVTQKYLKKGNKV